LVYQLACIILKHHAEAERYYGAEGDDNADSPMKCLRATQVAGHGARISAPVEAAPAQDRTVATVR
jgi:hypothetical protein